jgi:hypothetical protein
MSNQETLSSNAEICWAEKCSHLFAHPNFAHSLKAALGNSYEKNPVDNTADGFSDLRH